MKDKNQVKKHTVNVRVTEKEYQMLDKIAESIGASHSEIVRVSLRTYAKLLEDKKRNDS